jgi:hypothetical protein
MSQPHVLRSVRQRSGYVERLMQLIRVIRQFLRVKSARPGKATALPLAI